MPKTYKLTDEQKTEIMKAMDATKDAKIYKRLQALSLRGKGMGNKEIADVTGFHRKYITALLTKYLQHGVEAIQEDGRTSNNRNMTTEEEEVFLKPYSEAAEKGQVIEVSAIQKAYEKCINRKCPNSTIYRLLARHGWRKVMPRARHPKKASDEVIETSKKLNTNSKN